MTRTGSTAIITNVSSQLVVKARIKPGKQKIGKNKCINCTIYTAVNLCQMLQYR